MNVVGTVCGISAIQNSEVKSIAFGDLAEICSAIWRDFVRRFGGILFGELAGFRSAIWQNIVLWFVLVKTIRISFTRFLLYSQGKRSQLIPQATNWYHFYAIGCRISHAGPKLGQGIWRTGDYVRRPAAGLTRKSQICQG